MHTYKEIKNYIDVELESIKHPVTKDIRNIAHKVYVSMDKDLSYVIDMCDQLLKTEKWHYKTIAFDIIFKVKKQYIKQTFDIFESWLLTYIHDWGDCDDFCTHAFGYLLMNDDHYLVLKGYGWMLKVLSQKEPITVYNYLVKNHHQMPRVAYIYALEKLSKEQKNALMKL